MKETNFKETAFSSSFFDFPEDGNPMDSKIFIL